MDVKIKMTYSLELSTMFELKPYSLRVKYQL